MVGGSNMDFNEYLRQGLHSSPPPEDAGPTNSLSNIDPTMLCEDDIIRESNCSRSTLSTTTTDIEDSGAKEVDEDTYGSMMTLVQTITTSKKLKDTSFQELAVFAATVYKFLFFPFQLN